MEKKKLIVKKNVIEFYNWNIKTGPKHNNLETNIWVNIYDYLNKRDIPNAAFTLRRGLEQIFSKICDNLRVNVVYKINGTYDARKSTLSRGTRPVQDHPAQDSAKDRGGIL